MDPVALDPTQYKGSMRQAKDGADSDCWASPDGADFKIRGKTYLKDNTKVDPSPKQLRYLMSFICTIIYDQSKT